MDNTKSWLIDIKTYARELLTSNNPPEAVIQYRIRKEILFQETSRSHLLELQQAMMEHPQVKILQGEQMSNGGWGRFHSRDTRAKQKIPTTEIAIDRGIALGLDAQNPIFQKTIPYLVKLLENKIPYPGYDEKNDRWSIGKPLFYGSTLSLLVPMHPLIKPIRTLWREVLHYTFKSGNYNEQDEIQYHKKNTGATIKNFYLVLNNRYSLRLIGSGMEPLPLNLELAYLKWILQYQEGIGYLECPMTPIPSPSNIRLFEHWLCSLELLGRTFPNWVKIYHPALQWIWNQQISPGLWDFGPKATISKVLPLSKDWKKKERRIQDWSARILLLLSLIDKN